MFEVAEQQMWNYSSYVYEEKKLILRRGQRGQKIGVKNIKKQEHGVLVGQPIPV